MEQASKHSRIYVLALIWAIYATHSLDRSIILILLEPIRREYRLDDAQLGFVTGLGYAVPFALAGVPIGALADRVKRKRLLAALVATWSVMTALSGFTRSFAALVVSRAAVGATEAGAPSTMLSLLSDTFPPRRRPLVLGVFYTAPVMGLVGGSLLGAAMAAAYGWRAALFAAALPGLALALLAPLTLREPTRGAFGDEGHATIRLGFAEVARTLARSTRLTACMAALVLASVTLGASYWFPAFLIRVLHLNLRQAGPLTALVIGAPGGLGALAGGLASQRWGGAQTDKLMGLCAIALLIAVPFGIGGVLAPTPVLVCAGVAIWSFFNSFYIGPGYSVCLASTPVAMRGTVTALVVVLSNVLGAGLGPQLVGLLSDAFRRSGDPDGLAHALAYILAVGVVAAVLLIVARDGARITPSRPVDLHADPVA